MKNNILKIGLLFLFSLQLQAQYNRVNATNNQISENLDLRAVASIFGDAQNLEDFERRLNDPAYPISNLDLNYDNRVDYLRVVETVEQNTHLVIIQAVINFNTYQDVATIDIDRDYNNNLQVQVVGNNYIYGANCIYEPVYNRSPVIFASLFCNNYRPYTSNWRWNYYPKTYRTWEPCAVYRYKNNLQVSINVLNSYNYVNYRRCNRAVVLYQSRCSNGYERLHPEHRFSKMNNSYTNSYELEHHSQPKYVNNNYRSYNTSRERYYENSNRTDEANRYGASRPTYTQRTEHDNDYSRTKMSAGRESSTKIAENRRDYSSERSESPNRESNKQAPQTNRDYSQNNNTNTRENSRQNEGNSNRGNSVESERQGQSSSNSRRRI